MAIGLLPECKSCGKSLANDYERNNRDNSGKSLCIECRELYKHHTPDYTRQYKEDYEKLSDDVKLQVKIADFIFGFACTGGILYVVLMYFFNLGRLSNLSSIGLCAIGYAIYMLIIKPYLVAKGHMKCGVRDSY